MTNQIKILFYGVCLMMAVTGNSSTDIPNADVSAKYRPYPASNLRMLRPLEDRFGKKSSARPMRSDDWISSEGLVQRRLQCL